MGGFYFIMHQHDTQPDKGSWLFPSDYMTLDHCMAGDTGWIAARVTAWAVIGVVYMIFVYDCVRTMREAGWQNTYRTTGFLLVVFLFCGLHRLTGLMELWVPTQRIDTITESLLAMAGALWTVTRLGYLPKFQTPEDIRREREEYEQAQAHIAAVKTRLKGGDD